MAHAALAVNFFNAGRNEQGLAAAERALRFSERLGELERARIQGTYYLARRDYQEAARALNRVLAIDSMNHAAHNNLALVYDQIGDTLRARHHFERAVAADTGRFFAYTNLGEHLVLEGRLAEAEQALTQAVARAPTSAWPVVGLAQVPYIRGDIEGTQQRLLRLLEDPKLPESVQERAGGLYRQTLRVTGRLQEALDLSRAATLSSDGPEAAAAWDAVDRAYTDALLLGRPDRAAAQVRQLTQLAGKADDPDLATWVAITCAFAGDARCGQEALARAGLDGPLQPWTAVETRAAHAALALARKQPEAAHAILTGDDYRCRNCFLPMLGRTLRQMQEQDSAAAVYERFVRSTSMDRIWVDDELAPIHEWLAGYYEERGDRAAAARHYARFIELWQDADPELQPRVADARRRLDRLRPDR
jgi:tetratricopeptide (TPR) repeat protein